MFNVKRNPEELVTEVIFEKTLLKKLVDECFRGICYVCESNYHGFEVDHFYPKSSYPEKENDWRNLFRICPSCNKIKSQRVNSVPAEEILNCCEDDVENAISLYLDSEENIIIEKNESSVKVLNTLRFLSRIYNGEGSRNEELISHRQLKRDIIAECRDFEAKIYSAKMYGDPFKLEILKTWIGNESYGKEAQFLSFKRKIWGKCIS